MKRDVKYVDGWDFERIIPCHGVSTLAVSLLWCSFAYVHWTRMSSKGRARRRGAVCTPLTCTEGRSRTKDKWRCTVVSSVFCMLCIPLQRSVLSILQCNLLEPEVYDSISIAYSTFAQMAVVHFIRGVRRYSCHLYHQDFAATSACCWCSPRAPSALRPTAMPSTPFSRRLCNAPSSNSSAMEALPQDDWKPYPPCLHINDHQQIEVM